MPTVSEHAFAEVVHKVLAERVGFADLTPEAKFKMMEVVTEQAPASLRDHFLREQATLLGVGNDA